MSKIKHKIDNRQITIFDYLETLTSEVARPLDETKGRFRVDDALRDALRDAMKQCPLSRHQIAGEMSHLLNETITKAVLDSWTRESDEQNGRPKRHIPAEYLPAFCRVTGCNAPLAIMGKLVGLFVLPGPDALRAEIQRLDEETKKLQAEKRKRQAFLREMEVDGDL